MTINHLYTSNTCTAPNSLNYNRFEFTFWRVEIENSAPPNLTLWLLTFSRVAISSTTKRWIAIDVASVSVWRCLRRSCQHEKRFGDDLKGGKSRIVKTLNIVNSFGCYDFNVWSNVHNACQLLCRKMFHCSASCGSKIFLAFGINRPLCADYIPAETVFFQIITFR